MSVYKKIQPKNTTIGVSESLKRRFIMLCTKDKGSQVRELTYLIERREAEIARRGEQ